MSGAFDWELSVINSFLFTSQSPAKCVILPEILAGVRFKLILVSKLDSLPVFFKSGCALGGSDGPLRWIICKRAYCSWSAFCFFRSSWWRCSRSAWREADFSSFESEERGRGGEAGEVGEARGEREVVRGGGGGARRAASASSSGWRSGTGGLGGCWPRARTGGDASVSLPLGYECSRRSEPSPRSAGFANVCSSSSSASRAFSGRTSAAPRPAGDRPPTPPCAPTDHF